MTWRVVQRRERDILGEGLLWSPRENALFWTDIIGRKLWRLSFADNSLHHWEMPEMIGWIIEAASGGFVIGLQSGFHHLSLDPWRLQPIANPHPERPANRLNDAKADAHGRIWAGSMPVHGGTPATWPATGALYRLDPDGNISRHDDGLTIANGPAISPDGGTLFHTDSARGTVYRFALHPDGSLGPRTRHLAFNASDGAPDGMTCDADGGLWIAYYGGARVARFHPDGTLDRAIALPTPQITNVTFAGPALDRMFVTSAGDGLPDDPFAGALFEVDSGAIGLAPHRFGG
ncbi:MAG: SMP-30/gluconolactonase/LRE family protein [Polymorphobacter sp.]